MSYVHSRSALSNTSCSRPNNRPACSTLVPLISDWSSLCLSGWTRKLWMQSRLMCIAVKLNVCCQRHPCHGERFYCRRWFCDSHATTLIPTCRSGFWHCVYVNRFTTTEARVEVDPKRTLQIAASPLSVSLGSPTVPIGPLSTGRERRTITNREGRGP